MRTGAKEGDPKDLPPAPVFAAGWRTNPDVVLTIPEFLVNAASMNDYRIYLYRSHQLHRRQMDSGGRSSSGRSPRRASRHRLRHSGRAKWRRKWKSPPKPTREKTNITYRTGKVLHIRKDAPVLGGCGCSSPRWWRSSGHAFGRPEYRARHLSARAPGGNPAGRLRAKNSGRRVPAVFRFTTATIAAKMLRPHQHRPGIRWRTGEARNLSNTKSGTTSS